MTEAKYGRRMHGKLQRMRNTLVLGWMAAFLLGAIMLPQAIALAVPQNRIQAPIASSQMQKMKGTVSPRVAAAQDQGQMSGSTPIENMSMVFALSAALFTFAHLTLWAAAMRLRPASEIVRFGLAA